jgi:hypothetical protein
MQEPLQELVFPDRAELAPALDFPGRFRSSSSHHRRLCKPATCDLRHRVALGAAVALFRSCKRQVEQTDGARTLIGGLPRSVGNGISHARMGLHLRLAHLRRLHSLLLHRLRRSRARPRCLACSLLVSSSGTRGAPLPWPSRAPCRSNGTHPSHPKLEFPRPSTCRRTGQPACSQHGSKCVLPKPQIEFTVMPKSKRQDRREGLPHTHSGFVLWCNQRR